MNPKIQKVEYLKRLGGRDKEECLLFDRKFLFLKPDESVLELGSGDGCTSL